MRSVSLAVLMFTVLLVPSVARCTVLRVEKDGSAPFSVIQLAVNAAASGDTILIGPGEYLEAEMFQQDCCQELLTNVGVFQEELTIIGADRNSVLIGPEEASLGVVVAMRGGTSMRLHLEGVTVRGRAYGIRVFGESSIRDIRALNNWIGIFTIQDSLVIESSWFTDCRSSGIALLSGGRNATVRNCQFVGGDIGIDLFDNTGAKIHDNHFDLCNMAINVGNWSDPLIYHNTIDCAVEFGVGLLNQSTAVVTDNYICGGFAAMTMIEPTSAVVRRNLLVGGSNANLRLKAACDIEFTDNVLKRTTGYSVFLKGYTLSVPCRTIDLKRNYWFSTSGLTIANWIYDANDDDKIETIVEFLPLLQQAPVRTETSSVGGLKSRYR